MRRLRTWARATADAIALTARNGAVLRLELAYLAMFTATTMLLVGFAIVAFERAGAVGVSVLTVVQMAPAFLVVPFVAGIGDRLPRRRVLLASLLVAATAAAATAVVLGAAGPIELVFGLAALLAAATGVTWAVTTALLPALSRSPDELVGANVTTTAVEGVGGLVGPLLASVLLVAGGPTLIAAVGAGILVLAVMVAAGVRPAPMLPASLVAPRRMGAAGLVTEATDGLRTLWRLPGPRLITAGLAAQTFVRGALAVLLVVLAIDVLGLDQAGVGVLTAAMGLGGLVGSGLAAGTVMGRRAGPVLAVALLGWGLPIALIAPAQTTLVAVLMLVIVGVSNAFVDVSGFGLLQGSVPDRQRTAAMGAVRAVISLGVAAGGIAASALLSVAGVGVTLLVVGLLLPIVAIGWWPRWRDLDDQLLVSREQVDALRHCAIFAPLTLAQLEQLAAGTDPVRFDHGSVVILEGDPGDAFYLITGGEARATRAGVPLATLGTGDSFGEIALLRGVPRSATVTATSPLDTYRIDAVTFVSAITGNPCSRAAAEDAVARIAPALAR